MEINELEKLIKLFQNSDLLKLEWNKEGETLLLEKSNISGDTVVSNRPQKQLAAGTSLDKGSQKNSNASDDTTIDDENIQYITSPFVGTFYRSPSPGKPSFVNLGDKIKKGSPICIVEAMKLMNEIEADISGVVVSIMLEDGQPVEFGTKIFAIRPE